MENKHVKTDNYGLILTISTGITYTIGWWQIEKDGLRHWIDHLREKMWVTKGMEREVTEIFNERSRSVCYL